MAKLIFIGEKFKGRVYEFAVEKTTVGRGDHNTLTIHDSSVSHSHAEVLVYGTEVIVHDLGSSNGTYVNGVRLQDQQRPLLAGQVVEFGSVMAQLDLASSDMSDTVSDVTAVYSHARHLHEQQKEPKPTGPIPVTLDEGRPFAPDDPTLMLPRPPQMAEKIGPPSETNDEDIRKLFRKPAAALIGAAIVIGLAALCWLILVRNR